MTGGAHGGDVAEAVSPLSSAKASAAAAAAAGYALERRGDRGPILPLEGGGSGGGTEMGWPK